MSIGYRTFGILIALAAMPHVAYAHILFVEVSSFDIALLNGLLHPAVVPAHLLLLVALGLLLGQQGPKENHIALAVFFIATMLGLLAAWLSIGGEIELSILICAAIVGLLIVINSAIQSLLLTCIVALAGFAIGMDSAYETLSGEEKLAALFGSGVGIHLLLLYPMALAYYFNTKIWQKIAVRVIGSWIAASSVLVLALSFSASTLLNRG